MALERWNFDLVHSNVGFWIRHLMVSKVHGRFTKWSGSFAFDEQNPSASQVDVSIEAGSITTQEPQRDTHLRSPDFFDAEKFPQIHFKSTRVEKAGEGYKVTGDLSMHGVTKPVTLEVEYGGRSKHERFGERTGFSARTSLNRKDFGLVWNQALDAGGVALGDKVEVQIGIEATKAP